MNAQPKIVTFCNRNAMCRCDASSYGITWGTNIKKENVLVLWICSCEWSWRNQKEKKNGLSYAEKCASTLHCELILLGKKGEIVIKSFPHQKRELLFKTFFQIAFSLFNKCQHICIFLSRMKSAVMGLQRKCLFREIILWTKRNVIRKLVSLIGHKLFFHAKILVLRIPQMSSRKW